MKFRITYPFVILIIVLLVAVIAVMALLLLQNLSGKANDEISPDVSDEFTRAKDFINDWYSELSSKGKCSAYLNELQYSGGVYTLTYSSGRLRAVYPKGERFFKLEHISKVEFFEIDGILRCRFSYGESGEYMFKIG